MAQVPIEELLKQSGSLYKLVLLAAKRAKEVADGAPRLVESDHRKVTSVALEEILQGKVLYKAPESEAGSGKHGRGSRAREEKKRAVA